MLKKMSCAWVDMGTYSRVHITSDEVFSQILKKPSIVPKKMIPHMNAFSLFNKMKQKKKKSEKKNQNGRLKKRHFPAPPILNIWTLRI
jgi:hypothetical protein